MISAALDRVPDTDVGALAKTHVEAALNRNTLQTTMDMEIITTRQGFDALEVEWTDLYEDAGRPGNPFQSFAWCWHWANHFITAPKGRKETTELFILTGRTAGRLTMIWPIVRERSRGLTNLTWLGAPVTQYGDVLIKGDDPLPQLRQAWQYIRANAIADTVTLYKVREDAVIAPLMTEIGAVVTHIDSAPYVDMSQSDTFDDYAIGRYSKKRRSYFRRYRRRFEDKAPLTVEVLTAGKQARAVTEELLRFKQEWVAAKSIVSRALSDPRTNAFFLDTATDTERQTECRITTVRCGDELIGAKLNYVAKGRAIAHVITYNLEYDKWAPGHLTTYEGLRSLKEEGIDIFDFMAPNAPFKRDWSDNAITVNDWAVPLSMKGTLWTRVYLGFARDRLKAAHQALPASVKRLTSPLMSAVMMVG